MLDLAKCEEILTHLIEPEDVAGFFVCGPGPMMDAAEEALLERGVDKHKIHIERFTADRPSAAVEAQMHALQEQARGQIGRASGRERVCQYGVISRGAVSLKKKTKKGQTKAQTS